MERLFESSKIILDSLWFTEEYVSESEIDWKGIETAMTQMRPSSSEFFRYNLARDIYNESGMFYDLFCLDNGNKLRVLEAFKVLLELNNEEENEENDIK